MTLKDLCWKVFWAMALPLLPAGWIYIYFAFGEGWDYRHIFVLIAYVLSHGISYGMVQGIEERSLCSRSFVRDVIKYGSFYLKLYAINVWRSGNQSA